MLFNDGITPKTGYPATSFGQSWYNADRNGATPLATSCAGLQGLGRDPGPDPYTGTSIRFVYGGVSEIDIDHVVALSVAW
jgi:hypothetical protein